MEKRLHKKSNSEARFESNKQSLDKIMRKCTLAKREITIHGKKITKKVKEYHNAWKSMENILTQKNPEILPPRKPLEQEIHKKFHEIYEIHATEKKNRLSKLLVYSENNYITDKDMKESETFEFFAANRREFGSPLKEITIEKKKSQRKKHNSEVFFSIEQHVLKEIEEMRSKQTSPTKSVVKLSPIKMNKNESGEKKLYEVEMKQMSKRNQFIFGELKKINPNCFKKSSEKKYEEKMNSEEKAEKGTEKKYRKKLRVVK